MVNGFNERSVAVRPIGGSRRHSSLLVLLSFVFAVVASFSSAAEPRTVVFFGDSLTAGYGLADPAEESYPALIQKKIDAARRPWRVVNAGLSGETTAGGLRRVDWILRQPADIFVLALGANDGLRGIDPGVSRRNLEQIIARVQAKNSATKIVVAGMQMPASLGENFTREFQSMFPTVAEKNRATLIPFLLEGVGAQPKYNQGDRIHPNAAGHAIMAETVWKTLEPLLSF